MPVEKEKTTLIGKEVMDNLQACVGKTVKVEYAWNGMLHIETSTLRDVVPFSSIAQDGSGTPFIGEGSAIRRISCEGKVIYENKLIPENYDCSQEKEIDSLVRASFGNRIAQERSDKMEASRKVWQAEYERLDKKMRQKGASLIEQGAKLVKPELVTEWKEYALLNTQDFYSGGVVKSSINVMKALNKGKSPQNAMEFLEDDTSGFQEGAVAATVSHFHQRGEEFGRWWNKRFGLNENTKGIVNPAIVALMR